MRRTIAIGGCVAALTVLAAPARAACPFAEAEPDAVSVSDYATGLLCAINETRREWGRPELRAQRNLTQAAGSHAADMVRRGYAGHTAPDGEGLGDRLDRFNFIPRSDRWDAGENLAAGQAQAGTPAAIVGGWMASREHRLNLLDPGFTLIGIGVARGWPAPGDARNNAMTVDVDLGWRALRRAPPRTLG